MNRAAQLATGLAAGVTAWTFTEYAAHRWVLHGPFGKQAKHEGLLSRIPLGGIHNTHHQDPNWSVAWGRAAGHAAVAATGAIGARVVLSLAPGLPTGAVTAAAAAWSAGYSTYDIVHHRLHHRAPKTSLGVHMRQRHFRHHFAGARTNLGVTTGVWDQLLGTEAEARSIRVPSAAAPTWLAQLGDDFTSAAPSRQSA